MRFAAMLVFPAVAAGIGCTGEAKRRAEAEQQRPAEVMDLIDRKPVKSLETMYINGFHVDAKNTSKQMEVNLYCHRVNDDLRECAIIDPYGRTTGVEHIISRDAFDDLPKEEQVLWHPHSYAVKSGQLIAPGLPDDQEHALMDELVTTYGKAWDAYAEHPAALPMGSARLMKAFTADGQLDPKLLDDRDSRFRVSTEVNQARRSDIADPGFDPVVLQLGAPPGEAHGRER